MKPNPVGWFEMGVQDMARARAFYEAVLQTALQALPGSVGERREGERHEGETHETEMPEMCTFPMASEAPGAGGALVRMEGVASGGSTLVYFLCDDCAVEAARVPGAGGRIERAKTRIGDYGFIALAVDTEGNRFGLHSMR